MAEGQFQASEQTWFRRLFGYARDKIVAMVPDNTDQKDWHVNAAALSFQTTSLKDRLLAIAVLRFKSVSFIFLTGSPFFSTLPPATVSAAVRLSAKVLRIDPANDSHSFPPVGSIEPGPVVFLNRRNINQNHF